MTRRTSARRALRGRPPVSCFAALIITVCGAAGFGGEAIAAAAPPPAATATPSAGCDNCHDQPAQWNGRKTVHPPVKEGKCTACHSPHAARHASLLRRGGVRLCAGCHADQTRSGPGIVRHGAFGEEKGCLACHDPHATDGSDLLAGPPAQACATCHEKIFKEPPAQPHRPVARGECLTCHDPHLSTRRGLTRKAEPELCVSCHAPGAASFTAAHKGIPAGRARCTGCHAPHGSATAGMIHAVTHAPFAASECATCHDGIKPGTPLAAADSVALCANCHKPHAAGHPVPAGAACTSCHSPHASATAKLIAGPEQTVCVVCHQDIAGQRETAAAVHPPFGGTQDCTVCHEIHTGKTGALLKKPDPQATCVTCHGSHSQFAHPMGEGIADPSRPGRSVGCLSCHDPHGTAQPALLLADPRQDLCLRCHATGGF